MATRPIAPPTIADVSDQLPNLAPAAIGGNPIEDPASLHQLFGASSREAQRDISTADDLRILHGYQPIVDALGLDPTENPGQFGQLDAASEARFGNAGARLSKLATAAGVGEELPFTHNRMADRELQETLIAQEIQRRRKTQPNLLPGVPDTVDGIRKMILANEAKASAADQATLARSPGGITAGAVQFAGSTAGTFHDPLNVAALAIPGGEAKGLIQVAARDALINGLVELGETPIAAHNRHELGQSYTVGDAAWNVASAAAGGAILGPTLHVGGKAAGKALAPVSAKVNEAIMALAARGMQIHLDPKLPIDQALAELDNRQLVALHRQMAGEGATPDEIAAANTLERSADVAESSPYQPGPAGDGTHDGQLADSINEIINNRRPQDPAPATDAGARAPSTAPERPPAGTSTPAARPQASGDVETTIASFQGKVGHAENNTGNIHAKNPKSSASGPAQFTDPTFRDYYRKVYGQDPGEHPARELKDDPEVQSRLLARLTRDNADRLQAAHEPVTEGSLYLMHFAGPDAVRILKADPSTPIERLMSPKALEANEFLKGKSASEVIAWAHKKMGGAASSVPVRDAAGTLAPASEDPLTAQLNAEALALEPQIIGATRLPDGSPVHLYTRNVPSSEIGVDATRFQFKAGGDEFGVTDRLKGVKEWDPGLAGRVTLWQDDDGKLWIADGHQRHGLARRIGHESGADIPLDAMILRSADGVSAEDARVWAALKNIAEGTGSMVDAAKVLRDAGEHALDRLPPKSPLVRDGAALARLSDDAFGAVYNERIPADQAAVIGHLLPDNPETHANMVDLLIKTDPANRAQAQSIVRQAIAAGFHKEEQIDLFGSHSSVASLFAEKAKILERGLARLRKMRLVHNTAAAEADTLEQAGSKIAVEQSQREAQANAEAIAIVDRLAYRAGPVADALDVAARELAGGGKLTDATRQFIDRIRELDLASVSREDPVVDGGGANLDGAGRGGDAGEADAPLFAEPGDPPQPTLSELEAATNRFSDPDGPAVKQQAESLEHDLRAALEVPPEVLFHGTDHSFDKFDTVDFGAWFAERQGTAEVYMTKTGEGVPRLIRAKLEIKNPLVIPEAIDLSETTTVAESLAAINERNGTHFTPEELGFPGDYESNAAEWIGLDPRMIDLAKRDGFDGMLAYEQGERTWNAFSAEQIHVLDHGLAPPPAASGDKTAPFAAEFERLGVPDSLRTAIRDKAPANYDVAEFLANWEKTGQFIALRDASHTIDRGGLDAQPYLGDQPLDLVMFHARDIGEIAGQYGEGSRRKQIRTMHEAAIANQAKIVELGHELEKTVPGVEFVDPGVKSLDRVLAKSADYGNVGDIKDIARAGFLVADKAQADAIAAAIGRRYAYYDKGWKPLNGYTDRKLIVRLENGHVAEIQFIPKAIADYKFGEGHALYEKVSNPKTPPAEVEAALEEMRKGYETRLAGTDFEAVGKEAASSAAESGVPSASADRTVETDASRHLPESNTNPLFASDTATGRSSSSKNRMIGASSDALDMGEKGDPGKIARDRQLGELGAAAPLRAPSDVAQMGEIGLPLMDAHDQFKFRIDDGGEDISAEDLLAELAADKKATDALRGCL